MPPEPPHPRPYLALALVDVLCLAALPPATPESRSGQALVETLSALLAGLLQQDLLTVEEVRALPDAALHLYRDWLVQGFEALPPPDSSG